MKRNRLGFATTATTTTSAATSPPSYASCGSDGAANGTTTTSIPTSSFGSIDGNGDGGGGGCFGGSNGGPLQGLFCAGGGGGGAAGGGGNGVGTGGGGSNLFLMSGHHQYHNLPPSSNNSSLPSPSPSSSSNFQYRQLQQQQFLLHQQLQQHQLQQQHHQPQLLQQQQQQAANMRSNLAMQAYQPQPLQQQQQQAYHHHQQQHWQPASQQFNNGILLPTSTTSTAATTTTTISNTTSTTTAATSNTTTTTTSSSTTDTNTSTKSMEEFILKELNSMTLQERERVYEELHGVASPIVETPTLISTKLEEMDVCIQNTTHKPAYNMILQHYRLLQQEDVTIPYVNDSSFRLMFLRSDRYNVQDATTRFVQHLEYKHSLFGYDKLMKRSITLQDLLEGTATGGAAAKTRGVTTIPSNTSSNSLKMLDTLQSGTFQLLNQRDSSGRAVLFDATGYHGTMIHHESTLKLYWYVVMSALEDVESQKSGFVGILYAVVNNDDNDGNSTTGTGTGARAVYNRLINDREFFTKAGLITTILPMRVEAAHFCCNDPSLVNIVRIVQMAMVRDLRVRIRIHSGNHMECFYSLMTFGLPVDAIPIDYKNIVVASSATSTSSSPMAAGNDDNSCSSTTTTSASRNPDGVLKVTNHMKWLRRRKAKEDAIMATTATITVDGSVGKKSPLSPQQHPTLPLRLSSPTAAASTTPSSTPSSTTTTHSTAMSMMIDLPFKYDVLLGRGKPMQRHYGNKFLKELIGQRYTEYNNVKGKGKKSEIAQSIVNQITTHPYNGRFLKRNDTSHGFWEPVPNVVALERVCHGFRTHRGGLN